MNKEFIITKGLEMIKGPDMAFLTTVDSNGFPSTRAMLNLRKKHTIS